MHSKILLSKLTPLKPVMCVVRSTKGLLGTAISDPYLAFAKPLKSLETVHEVDTLILETRVGALVFGLPLQISDDDLRSRERIMRSHDWSVPLVSSMENRISLSEALSRKETEWEMWEEIDNPADGKASTEAAVALNGWLWEHCSGWRNTFG
mmetsp:Transcript_6123/g.9402  ORF Transcript_6123/g.9402 Transcript_6123/m.9402 type:complete len:152 (-) Transcript_6123:1158-1613(-)|eukprot:CAMPEP_0178923332 /NCGR_PEP_ID=MMETSP0786-20121207/16660_1 /TAXON_ID=186022 /ORGANISM="Thalassionema frauenfeldii, Strain CCMP 1798" /LENGTH=151 /DNA_ID=CAMNT_0020597815 /DNA_START=118 /DNA_END=573 /DNA_ORIENTATION=-